MQKLTIDDAEVAAIQTLLAALAAAYGSAEDPGLLMESTLLAHELPRRVRGALNSFRLTEPESALFILSGYPVDECKIGPTPAHWHRPDETRSPALAEEILFALTCSLLGDCIGWQTQQGGRIIHDVMPIRGMEQEQIGTGSEQAITWHTEDAFHPLHGDYLAMMCLRNPDRVATTFASLERLALAPEDWETLFEPHYTIHPDNSHLPENSAHPEAAGNGHAKQFARIEQLRRQPEKIAVLAFAALTAALDGKLADVVLEPGDICFIDNRKAVHGRRAFKARYDGRDRWFKRTNITRDLRKSRQARAAAAARIIQ